ncbi:helix-turn-helix transcriptional regulator [Kitasatospora putterlickiae]
MVLVGRVREESILDELLMGCSAGRGGVALVTGVAASGKTELMNAFVRHASEAGALVLSAMATRSESEIPFGVVDQLSHNALLAPEDVHEIQGAIEAGVLLADVRGSDPDRIHPEHAKVLARLHVALTRLSRCGSGPLVIAVDDLQESDRFSLQLLRYLARRITNQPVLMVLNVLSETTTGIPLFLMEIVGQSNTRRIRLEPLSGSATAQLMANFLESADVARLLPEYERLSGGNPLLVRGLLDDHRGGPGGPADRVPHVADGYRQAVTRSLRRTDPNAAEAAYGLAVLGLPRVNALVGRLLAVETDALERCEQILLRTGLLGPSGFRHPEARAAVLDSLDPARRGELHLRAARLLFIEGAPATEVAGHLLAADAAPDPWAVRLLLEAAEQVLSEDQVELAAEYSRLAHREAAEPDQRADVTLMLAQIDGQGSPVAAVRHCVTLTEALHEGKLNQSQAIQLVKYLLQQGPSEQAESALRHLCETLRQEGVATTSEWEAFRLWLGCTFPLLAGRFAPLTETSGQPRDSTNPYLQASRLLDGVLRGTLSEAGIDAVQEHLQTLGLNETTLEPLTVALTALVYADRQRAAVAWGDELLREARARNIPSWLGVLSSVMAKATVRSGDLAAAERHAAAALEWRPEIKYALATQALVRTARGDLDAAGGMLNRPLRSAVLENPSGLYYRHARGHYYLAIGRAHAALMEFRACGQDMRAWEMDLPSLVPWRSDLAQALIALGRTDEARELATEQLSALKRSWGRTRALTLRVIAEASGAECRPPLLAEALASLEESPDQVERSRIHGLLGRTHRLLGDADAAGRHIQRARQLAKDCQADGLLPGLPPEDEPQPVAAGRGAELIGIEDLSKAEQRVARLVSQGFTNSEVADKLFITVSTVEQHLTRIYRKLGLKHRSALQSLAEGVLVDSC